MWEEDLNAKERKKVNKGMKKLEKILREIKNEL
jgi:hypothetical protein